MLPGPQTNRHGLIYGNQFRRRIFIFSLCCLISFFTAFAQESALAPAQFSTRIWPVERNLSRCPVQAIAQTPDGYLWIGTQNGLARFDGERCEFLPVEKGNVKAEWVNALCVSQDGALWIGTGGAGLFRYQNGNFTHCPSSGEVDGVILALREGQPNSIWCGTRAGLAAYSEGKWFGPEKKNTRPATPMRHLAFDAIRCLTEDAGGKLWIGAQGRMIHRDRTIRRDATNDPMTMVAMEPDANGFIRAMHCDRAGHLWLGSNAGLSRYADGRFTHFTKDDGLPDNTVTAVYEDLRGNLWIGTYGGLVRFVQGRFVTQTTPEGEPHDQIFCFYEDRENNLWAGSKEGLCLLRPRPFAALTTRQGLAHNNVISVCEDTQSNLWVGTWGGGLHQFKEGKTTVYAQASTPILRNDLILALAFDRDGSLWFGTDYDGGLYRWQEGQITRWGPEQGIPHNALKTILPDRAGRLWIGTANQGLRILEPSQTKARILTNGLPGGNIRCLLEVPEGVMWVGTDNGLACWTNQTFVCFTTNQGLSDNTILSLHHDRAGALWIGTKKGLNRRVEGKFTTYTTAQGLFDDTILEIVEDDFARLWISCYRGVFRVDKTDLAALDAGRTKQIITPSFGSDDGLGRAVCVSAAKPAGWKTADGRIWFATTRGVIVTDPKLQMAKNEKPPFVVIREMKVSGVKHLVSGNKTHLTAGIAKPDTISFPPGRGELEFHYAALSYTAPEKNRYKYKLEGWDNDWIDAGTRREAFYNNVPPGDYTFRVIACNNDGVWNALGQNVKFTLPPHYWQTKWFFSLMVLAGVGLIAATVRYALWKKMQRQIERLEQQHAIEKERTRIARDMHDEFGARLTEIALLSNLAKNSGAKEHAEKISASAHELVRGLDAIVWAVDPAKDSLENLVFYLQEYIELFHGLSPIRFRFDAPEDLPDCAVSSEVRHHVFLAVKEALNNAVKYSGASEVWLRVRMTDSVLVIEVEDNGQGFDRKKVSPSANGLANMEKRLYSVGGELVLESEPGKGTRVRLKIPLKP